MLTLNVFLGFVIRNGRNHSPMPVGLEPMELESAFFQMLLRAQYDRPHWVKCNVFMSVPCVGTLPLGKDKQLTKNSNVYLLQIINSLLRRGC